MKNANFIFTKSRMGLDKSVWQTMFVVLACSVLFLSFKIATHVDCSTLNISTAGLRQQNDNVFYIGETITFSISAAVKDSIEWNFDDGSPITKKTNTTQHSFLKEGNFTVSCLINNKCEQTKTVSIIPAPLKPRDTTLFIGTPIIGPDTIMLGSSAHYKTLIKADYNYQWTSSGSPEIQSNSEADFTFYREGLQMLTLKIDGSKNYTKTLFVISKKSTINNSPANTGAGLMPPKPLAIPPAINFIDPPNGGNGTSITINGSFFSGTKSVSFGGSPAKIISVSPTQIIAEINGGATGPVVVTTENGTTTSSVPFTYIAPPKPEPANTGSASDANGPAIFGITNKTLMRMLEQVKGNTMHVQDFDNYFCSKGNTKVLVNNDSKMITFTELCQNLLTNGKKITIDTAIINKDPDNTKCVASINVRYKVSKGFFKRVFH